MDALAITAVLLLLVAAPVIVVNRDLLFNRSAARRSLREEPLPFLIIPSSPGAAEIIPGGVAWNRTAPEAEATLVPEPAPPPVAAAAPAIVATPVSAPSEAGASAPEPSSLRTARPRQDRKAPTSAVARMQERWARPVPVEEETEDPPADATIVFNRPMDEPVQILPGRLQVLSGETPGEDLRLFSKLGEPPQIVVGRETGPPHRHITLRSPTVSRRHARMDFIDGHWTITNLSSTNPVLVNDRVLKSGSSTRRLSDGDRIELGEVALRFLAG
jgi:hypothetical protein